MTVPGCTESDVSHVWSMGSQPARWLPPRRHSSEYGHSVETRRAVRYRLRQERAYNVFNTHEKFRTFPATGPAVEVGKIQLRVPIVLELDSPFP